MIILVPINTQMSNCVRFPHELFALCLFESENFIKVTRHDTCQEWLDQMHERIWFLRCQKECPYLFSHIIPNTPYEKIHAFLVRSRTLLKQGRERLTRTVASLFVAFRMPRAPRIHLSLTMGYINDPVPGRVALYVFAGGPLQQLNPPEGSYQTMIEEIEGYYVPSPDVIFSHIGAPRVVAQVLGYDTTPEGVATAKGGEEMMVYDPESNSNSKSRIYRCVTIHDMIDVLRLATSCGFYPLPLTRVVS